MASRYTVNFDPKFFGAIMRSAGVEQLTRATADAALAVARANAPVDTGAYRDGLVVEKVPHKYRDTYMVVGHDPKTLLVESRTGNLKRALKAACAKGGK